MRIKKHENLTKANIAKVIELLEQEKPITKKEACSILNITYNTTRLVKIIDEHKLDIERTSRMKSKLRGKPATDDDIRFVVQRYLTGENVSSIASSMYRSPAFVKNIIQDLVFQKKCQKNPKSAKENGTNYSENWVVGSGRAGSGRVGSGRPFFQGDCEV